MGSSIKEVWNKHLLIPKTPIIDIPIPQVDSIIRDMEDDVNQLLADCAGMMEQVWMTELQNQQISIKIIWFTLIPFFHWTKIKWFYASIEIWRETRRERVVMCWFWSLGIDSSANVLILQSVNWFECKRIDFTVCELIWKQMYWFWCPNNDFQCPVMREHSAIDFVLPKLIDHFTRTVRMSEEIFVFQFWFWETKTNFAVSS